MKARRKEFADKSTSDSNDIVDEKQEEESEPQEVESDKAIHSSRETFQPNSMDEKTLKECIALAGLHEYSTYEEVPNNLRRRIRVSCFPPTEEEVAKFHLDRCMRIMPQDMDTGGFFLSPQESGSNECRSKSQIRAITERIGARRRTR